MKTTIKALFVLLIIAVITGGLAWYFLPKVLVKTITTESTVQVIPTKVKTTINKKIDQVPLAIEEMDLDITIYDIIELLEKMTVKEITQTIKILNNTELVSEQQVVNIVRQNINFHGLDTEKARKAVLKRLKLHDVKKALKMINESGRPFALTIPVAKETIKGILIEKQKKIEAELNQS